MVYNNIQEVLNGYYSFDVEYYSDEVQIILNRLRRE